MASSEKKKKVHPRYFQDSWMTDPLFEKWLVKNVKEDKSISMLCHVCQSSKVKNVFTTGCTEFQRSTLTRHISSESHQRAIQVQSSRSNFLKSVKCAEQKCEDSLNQQLKTVFSMVENNIPLHTYVPLIELQKLNGCEGLASAYVSHEAVSDMVHCLSSTISDDMKKKIEDSKFLGILMDESCDVAIFKKLVIYVQTVNSGRINVQLAAHIDVPDGKADTICNAVQEWMASMDIPIAKVMGLATDGAAVMTGARSGVGVRLKQDNPKLVHIHCVAHRLALAVSQAAASVRNVKAYEDTVQGVYFFFHNSAVRYNRLRAVYALLEDDDLITLKRPHAVRWLSLHQAVAAIHACWGALVTTLGEEAVNNDQARGYLRQVDKFAFIALSCILVDILPLFTKLSKVFQRACLDFSAVRLSLQTVRDTLLSFGQDASTMTTYAAFRHEVSETGNYQGQPVAISEALETSFIGTKDALLGSLIEKLEQRFPSETMDIMTSFDSILSPKLYPADHAAIPTYGVAELKRLLDHYQPVGENPENVLLDRDRCLRDFLPFKHYTRHNSNMTFADYTHHVIENLLDQYPDFVVLGQLALCVPLNSASCERGFSAQNLNKTKSRNRLGQKTLEDIMRISVNGPHFADFDYTEPARKFRAIKDRKK